MLSPDHIIHIKDVQINKKIKKIYIKCKIGVDKNTLNVYNDSVKREEIKIWISLINLDSRVWIVVIILMHIIRWTEFQKTKKIVVKVADNHLIPTKYGYALVLDRSHVVFLKDWQVDVNWFGNEVLINRDFWNVKEWGTHDAFVENEEALTFEHWLRAAKEQDDFINEDGFRSNYVKWHK